MTPSRQRDLTAQLRHEAHQTGNAAPGDLAERIIAGLPPRPRRYSLPRLVVAVAIAAVLVLATGLWWMQTPPVVGPAVASLPVPAVDIRGMPDFVSEPERPLTGELAALRRDGERLLGFFTEVGAPLRSAINLGAEPNHAH